LRWSSMGFAPVQCSNSDACLSHLDFLLSLNQPASSCIRCHIIAEFTKGGSCLDGR
jgi:hypothetical protein